MDNDEEHHARIFTEGRAVLSVTQGVFYSEHQVLQRDLSVAVLRAFRHLKKDIYDGHEGPDQERTKQRSSGQRKSPHDACGVQREGEKDATTPVILRVCDALAGGGVRAIRYALEAGPVQIVANDRSEEACQAICRSAHVSGIDNVVCVRTSAAAAHPAVAESAEVGQRVGSESDTATRAGGTDELSPPSCPLSSLFESRCMDKTGNTGRTDGPSFSVRAGDANVLLFSPAAGADAGAETLESAAAGAGTSEADVPDTTAAKTPPKAAPINTATGRQEAGSRDAPGRHDIRGRKGYGGLDQAPVAEANEEILSSESWDFVDVDPFGSCMPFLEAAVQGVRDGGVLAIAATDLAALCGKKGGVSQKSKKRHRRHGKSSSPYEGSAVADTPYAKEGAIRVLLHKLSVLARRKGGRRIVPLLCVALDFYVRVVRLFVMVVPPATAATPGAPALQSTPCMIKQRLDSPEYSVVAVERPSPVTVELNRDSMKRTSVIDGVTSSLGDSARSGMKNHFGEGRECPPRCTSGETPGNIIEGLPEGDRGSDAARGRMDVLEADGRAGTHGNTSRSPVDRSTEEYVGNMEVEEMDVREREDTHLEAGNNEEGKEYEAEHMGRRSLTLGPFWAGPLFHPAFLAAVLAEVRLSHAPALEQTGAAVSPSEETSKATIPALAFSSTARQTASHVAPMTPAAYNGIDKSGTRPHPSRGIGGDTAMAAPHAAIEVPSLATVPSSPFPTAASAISVPPSSAMMSCRTQDIGAGSPIRAAREPNSTTPSFASKKQLLFLLGELESELPDCPFYYTLQDVAGRCGRGFDGERGHGRGGGPLPKAEAVREQLRSAGYECSGSHTETRALKTRGPVDAVMAAVARATAEKAMANSRREENQQQQHQAGSLQAARARITHGSRQTEAGLSLGLAFCRPDGIDVAVNVGLDGVVAAGDEFESVTAIESFALDETEDNDSKRRTLDQTGSEFAHHTFAAVKRFLESLSAPEGNGTGSHEINESPEEGVKSYNESHGNARRVNEIDGYDGNVTISSHHHRATLPNGARSMSSPSLLLVVCGVNSTRSSVKLTENRRDFNDLRHGGTDVDDPSSGRDGLGDTERPTQLDEKEHIEQLFSSWWPGRTRFFDRLRDACASLANGKDERGKESRAGGVESKVIIAVLGGRHDVGRGGLRLSAKGTTLVGFRGRDGCLPIVDGPARSHAITCTGRDISIRSLRVCAGSSHPVATDVVHRAVASACTSELTPASGVARREEGANPKRRSAPSTAVTVDVAQRHDGKVNEKEAFTPMGQEQRAKGTRENAGGENGVRLEAKVGTGDGGSRRKRPRLIFDRQAAQAVIATASAAAAVVASAAAARKRKTPRRTNGRRDVTGSRDFSPAHAISVEHGGSAVVSDCNISSVLPFACASVSGAASVLSLEGTRLLNGAGMGLLVCGKAEASAVQCSFEGMGAAGVEARGGSKINLTKCLVSECGRSGVFLQGFSRACISGCNIVGSAHAGVEVMRNAALTMDTCNIVNSRRGGVLVHVASRATLKGCDVSGSRLSGVDARTGGEAVLDGCIIRGGKASGMYVSAGGSATISSTRILSNRLAAIEVNEQQHRPNKAAATSSSPSVAAAAATATAIGMTTTVAVPSAREGEREVAAYREESASNLAARASSRVVHNSARASGAFNDGSVASAAVAAAVAVPFRDGCSCISLGPGNIMSGNGLDSVMRVGDPA